MFSRKKKNEDRKLLWLANTWLKWYKFESAERFIVESFKLENSSHGSGDLSFPLDFISS
jgi:hypothetical protein